MNIIERSKINLRRERSEKANVKTFNLDCKNDLQDFGIIIME
jgi:hypothetical protein